MRKEHEIKYLLTELVNMIDNGSQRDLDRADEICSSIISVVRMLEQASKAKQFARWVAEEIFDDAWEDNKNKDAFTEIACRKLEKLGIVRANGDEWELVETQESEEDNQ